MAKKEMTIKIAESAVNLLTQMSWFNEEDDGNWDDTTLKMVSILTKTDEDTLTEMLSEYGFCEYEPYEFVANFENIKREYEEA